MVERLKDGAEADIIRINAISFYERYIKEVELNGAEWREELEAFLPPNVKKVTVCIEQPNMVLLFILHLNIFFCHYFFRRFREFRLKEVSELNK